MCSCVAVPAVWPIRTHRCTGTHTSAAVVRAVGLPDSTGRPAFNTSMRDMDDLGVAAAAAAPTTVNGKASSGFLARLTPAERKVLKTTMEECVRLCLRVCVSVVSVSARLFCCVAVAVH